MELNFNEVNTIEGIYSKCFLSQKSNTTHYGYYKIVVNDSLEIILLPPYYSDAKRAESEVKKYEGKKVSVTGKIEARTFFEKPTIYNNPQSVNIPCFVTVDAIKLLN